MSTSNIGNIKQVACGSAYTFVLTEDNKLRACGYNNTGQLGLGDIDQRNSLAELNWTGGTIKQIACGTAHTFVLTEDNQLWACGYNQEGQLGIISDSTVLKQLNQLDWTGGPIKQVACGFTHTFVLTEDSQLWACGLNYWGQLGLGDNNNSNILTKLDWTGGSIKQIACGDTHTFVLTDDNQLWACGANYQGQLGLDDYENKKTLTKLSWTNGSIKQIACAGDYTFVLTEDNQLWACGDNQDGQLGIGDLDNSNILTKLDWTDGSIKQIACGSTHTFVLTEDNNESHLWACGKNDQGQLGFGDNVFRGILTKLNWTNGRIKLIVCGGSHKFVLTEDNQLWACGLNNSGQLGLGDTEATFYLTKVLPQPTAEEQERIRQERIAQSQRIEGERHERMRRQEEEMYRLSQEAEERVRRQQEERNRIRRETEERERQLVLENKKQVACGSAHTFVLTEDSQLWACGSNNSGQLGLGDEENRSTLTKLNWTGGAIKQVICGGDYTFVLTIDNQLWVCGDNVFGQLGLGEINRINTLTKLNWTGGAIKQVACGKIHTFVLTDDNQLWACGDNSYSQLGLGDRDDRNTLTKLNWTGGTIKQVACGGFYTFVLTDNNQLWACGNNFKGQLGLGDDDPQKNTLTKLDWTGGTVKQMACGGAHTFVLTEDDQLWACGFNRNGQLGLGDEENRNILTDLIWTDESIKQVACGRYHTFVLTQDEELGACGDNQYGQLGFGDLDNRTTLIGLDFLPPGAIKQIECGDNHTFVLAEDNQLWACGSNESGQIGFYGDSRLVGVLIKIYLESEDPDGRFRQIQRELLEQGPPDEENTQWREQDPTEPTEPTEPPMTLEQRHQVFEQQREAARRVAEEYEGISLTEAEENIKLLYQQACDNKKDPTSLEEWHELDQDERKNIVSISLNGQGRTCHVRDNLIMALNAAQEFVEWERNPLARQMDDEGHGGRPKVGAPRYVKFVHDINVFVDRPSTLELLGKPEYHKFNLEIIIENLRIGNLEGNILEIGGIHGQAPGHPIAKLSPVTGKLFEAPPPLNEVPQQEGGKHKSKYQREYFKAKKRYRLLKAQFK